MIVHPKNQDQLDAMHRLLEDGAGVLPSFDLDVVGWVKDDKLVMVVGFNHFIGKCCQIHVSMARGFNFTPKAMLAFCFDYIFNKRGMKVLIGIVNSKNQKALKYDMHLGFTAAHCLPGVHDDGGDLVMLTMTREDCKYLEKKEAA